MFNCLTHLSHLTDTKFGAHLLYGDDRTEMMMMIIIIIRRIRIITVTDLYSAYRSEGTEVLDAAQED